MIVKIFGIEKGLEIYQNVDAIRIKSKDYNLLVLKGYLSIIGEISGSFEIEAENKNILYDNIHAYYINNDNIFNIILGSVNNG